MRIPAAVAFGSGHEVGDRNKMELVSVVDDDNLPMLMLMSRDDERIFLRRRNAEATTTLGDDDDDKIIILYFVPKWPLCCGPSNNTTYHTHHLILGQHQSKQAGRGGERRERKSELLKLEVGLGLEVTRVEVKTQSRAKKASSSEN